MVTFVFCLSTSDLLLNIRSQNCLPGPRILSISLSSICPITYLSPVVNQHRTVWLAVLPLVPQAWISFPRHNTMPQALSPRMCSLLSGAIADEILRHRLCKRTEAQDASLKRRGRGYSLGCYYSIHMNTEEKDITLLTLCTDSTSLACFSLLSCSSISLFAGIWE